MGRKNKKTGAYIFPDTVSGFVVVDPVAAALTDSSCSPDEENQLQRYLYVFLLGQTLHGIGGTTLYIVGVALIDDSVPSSASPLYVGKDRRV